jgi:hypothetical protein
MTERAVVEFDHAKPEDVGAQINAAIRAFEMSSFDRLFRRLTELAGAILEAAEIPSDPRVMYVMGDNEGVPFIEPAKLKDVSERKDLLSLDQAVLALRFKQDSAEGYAGRILTKLHLSRQLLQDGDAETAMALAYEVGALVTEASMKAVFEPDFITGEKVRAGGTKGHQNAYGSKEERIAKYATYVAAFEKERRNGVSKMFAYEIAARKCHVSETTIQRAVRTRPR